MFVKTSEIEELLLLGSIFILSSLLFRILDLLLSSLMLFKEYKLLFLSISILDILLLINIFSLKFKYILEIE